MIDGASITNKKLHAFFLLSPGIRSDPETRVCNVFEPLRYDCMNDNITIQISFSKTIRIRTVRSIDAQRDGKIGLDTLL